MQKWYVSFYVLCEVLILTLVVNTGSSSLPLILFGHFLVSGLVTFFLVFRGDRWLDLTKAFCVFVSAFCLPVIGILPVFLLLSVRDRSISLKNREATPLNLCEIEVPNSALMQSGRADSLQLLHSLHDDAYLELLLSARALPEHQSLKLWGEAMRSVDENARLVGYCFANEMQEVFQQRLQKILNEIKQNKSCNRGRKHLLVANLYWQYFRLGLLHEKDHLTILKKIAAHSMQSIKLNETSPQSYALLGEVMQLRKRDKEAQYFFQKAKQRSTVSPLTSLKKNPVLISGLSAMPVRQAA